jgi:hypothetical protein
VRKRPVHPGAEGATAPETLRQKDRSGVIDELWRAAGPGKGLLTEGAKRTVSE